jgi:BirA family transcriptional regulator, biotin operon repressor / biotin---[acetyl-CoA-carboxylase] ligase
MHQPDPTFPPLFTGHAVKAPQTAVAEACRRAAIGELGAGDLVWSRNTAQVECALVLEPDVTLTRACQMAALGMVAVVETLGHLGPPQMPIGLRWPDTLLIDGAAAGSVRLWAAQSAPDKVPSWLVLAITLTLTAPANAGEPGDRLATTSLYDEGAGEITRTAVIEALATRLLAWLHTWGQDGFRPIHSQWLFYAEGRGTDVFVDHQLGRVLGLDEDGNLLFKRADGLPDAAAIALAFLPHVRTVS